MPEWYDLYLFQPSVSSFLAVLAFYRRFVLAKVEGMEQVDAIDDKKVRRAFGARVREFREHEGWTQDELAHRLEKSSETVHKLESGKRIPRLPDIFRLAIVFDVSVADLLDIEDAPSRDTEKRKALRDLIRLIRHDDPAHIRMIADVARRIRPNGGN